MEENGKSILNRRAKMSGIERKIWNKMRSYDWKYFSDMRFENRELRKFGRIQVLEKEGNESSWRTTYDDFPLWQAIPDLSEWIIKEVDEKEMEALGMCEEEEKMIKVAKGLNRSDLKLVLLHEIIHAYEGLSKPQTYAIYRQLLVLYFHEKLRKKIESKALEEIIGIGLNFFIIEKGCHTPLFLLKSLDLDLRLNKPWGTVHSYEREDFFDGIQRRAIKRREKKT